MKEKTLTVAEILENKLRAINERNLERVEKAKESMGKKYLCHPSNRVTRVTEQKEYFLA